MERTKIEKLSMDFYTSHVTAITKIPAKNLRRFLTAPATSISKPTSEMTSDVNQNRDLRTIGYSMRQLNENSDLKETTEIPSREK